MLSIVSKLKNFEIEQLLVWPVLAAKLSRRHDGSPGSIPVAGPICPCAPFSGLWQRNPGVLTFSPVEEHTSILLLAALRPGWDLRHPDEAGAPDCGTAYTVGRTSGPDDTPFPVLPSVVVCHSYFLQSELIERAEKSPLIFPKEKTRGLNALNFNFLLSFLVLLGFWLCVCLQRSGLCPTSPRLHARKVRQKRLPVSAPVHYPTAKAGRLSACPP